MPCAQACAGMKIPHAARQMQSDYHSQLRAKSDTAPPPLILFSFSIFVVVYFCVSYFPLALLSEQTFTVCTVITLCTLPLVHSTLRAKSSTLWPTYPAEECTADTKLKYLSGNALTDDTNCIGPNGSPYPRYVSVDLKEWKSRCAYRSSAKRSTTFCRSCLTLIWSPFLLSQCINSEAVQSLVIWNA